MNVTAISPDEEPAAPAVDVVVPVYNEEADLERSVRRLHAYLRDHIPVSARVTIVDNGSTDGTGAIAAPLERELPDVRAVHVGVRGRGGALAGARLDSDAVVVACTDVDLSTDLDALLPLVAPLLSGHSELAIGSRLSPGARVVRRARRELISRCYNLLLKLALGVRFHDAQCGFKAIRADAARQLVPLVENRHWFFDTERGGGGLAGDHLGGLVAFALALVCTNLSLISLLAQRPDADRTAELAVLLVAGAAATVARFALLRALIFERRRRFARVVEIPGRQA